MLSINNLHFNYQFGEKALTDVSFYMANSSKIFCIYGGSEAGKTTLLKSLCYLQKPSSGLIWFNKNLISEKNARFYFQIIPKDEGFFKNKSVFYNLDFLLKLKIKDKYLRILTIEKTLKELNIYYLKNEKLYNLTTYEMAAFLISKAYVKDANIVLIDDVLSELPPQQRGSLLSHIYNLSARQNKYVIYATSTYDDCITLNSDSLILRYGIVQQQGNSISIKNNPQRLYVDKIANPERNFIENRLINSNLSKLIKGENFNQEKIISYMLKEVENDAFFLKALSLTHYFSQEMFYVTTDLGIIKVPKLKATYKVSVYDDVRVYSLKTEKREH